MSPLCLKFPTYSLFAQHWRSFILSYFFLVLLLSCSPYSVSRWVTFQCYVYVHIYFSTDNKATLYVVSTKCGRVKLQLLFNPLSRHLSWADRRLESSEAPSGWLTDSKTLWVYVSLCMFGKKKKRKVGWVQCEGSSSLGNLSSYCRCGY